MNYTTAAAKRLKGNKLLCTQCHKWKFIEKFHKRTDGILNRSSHCGDCENLYTRKWRKIHPMSDEARQKNKDYRKNHKIKMRRYERKRLLAKYGLDFKQHSALLKSQRHACAICNRKSADKSRKALHIDHCHKTNKVRGLLCASCNVALGHLHTTFLLKKAIAYLERTR